MNKGLVVGGGVAVVAVLIYVWYRNQNPAAATVGSTVVGSTNNPVTGQSTTTLYAGNGSIPVPSAVAQWIQTLATSMPNNYAQLIKQLPNMTQSDMNGLLDLIVNQWGKGAQPTQAQVAFWDGWRVKYHIDDGTISNFKGRGKGNGSNSFKARINPAAGKRRIK